MVSGSDERPVESDGWPLELVVAVQSAVATHVPQDGREARAQAQITAGLGRLDRPFDELAGPEHVTASAVVVGPRGTVLHMHKRLHRWLHSWLLVHLPLSAALLLLACIHAVVAMRY